MVLSCLIVNNLVKAFIELIISEMVLFSIIDLII